MILNQKNHRRKRMTINSITVKEGNEVIPSGISIDNKVIFKKHIANIYRTAQYKLQALTHIRKYLAQDKAILLGTILNSRHLRVLGNSPLLRGVRYWEVV